MDLIFDRPAREWTEAIPVGNGRIGGMVFGGVGLERIQINDDRCWSGGGHLNPAVADQPPFDPALQQVLPQLRTALDDGDLARAEELSRKLQVSHVAAFQPLIDLWVDDRDAGTAPHNYLRQLTFATGTVVTSWQDSSAAGTPITHHQETFVSHPDQALVHHRRVTGGTMAVRVRYSTIHPQTQHGDYTGQDEFSVVVQMPQRIDPQYAGYTVQQYAQAQDSITAVVHVTIRHDGQVADGWIVGASYLSVVVTTETDFVAWNQRPHHDVPALVEAAAARGAAAASRGVSELLRRHQDDFGALFNRFSLQIAAPEVAIPTADRLAANHDPANDPGLANLLVGFGQYLTISGSRPGTLPLNLQGIWNEKQRPPWSSNYTLNINLEMNYWLTELVGLPECAQPLISFLGALAASGQITARELYEAPGWTAHHNSDIWAYSAPAGDGTVKAACTMWPLAGAWLSRHLWEHWQFTQDDELLRTKLLPIMASAAEFCQHWLIENPDGTLGTSPSTSPENTFLAGDGEWGVTASTEADLAMIRDLFTATTTALAHLGRSSDPLHAQLTASLQRLPKPQITPQGTIAEWSQDYLDADPLHRHQTHLYGVMPGEEILPATTPELAAAAAKTLDNKGRHATGWSLAWRTGLRARLGDALGAMVHLKDFLAPMPRQASERAAVDTPAGLYNNLFCAHPPFQIDGNFGIATAIIEMIAQSHGGQITLLPALPTEWDAGSIRGLAVRGGGTLDLTWQGGQLQQVRLQANPVPQVGAGADTTPRVVNASHPQRSFVLCYGSTRVAAALSPGESVTFDGNLAKL